MKRKNLYLLIFIINLTLISKVTASFSVSSTDPYYQETNIGRKPKFTLNFPNNVCTYMTMVYLRLYNDSSIVDLFSSGDYSGLNTSTVTFSVHSGVTLNSNTQYYLDITGASFYDCNSPPTNFNNSYNLVFTTGTCLENGSCPFLCVYPIDAEVDHLSPPNNSHHIHANQGLNIVFDRNVTVGQGNVTIKKYSDNAILETIDITSNQITGWGTNTILINPSVNFVNGTRYYINFDFTGYQDTADKDKWNFYIKSTPNSINSGDI
jgi:hypothetical protein